MKAREANKFVSAIKLEHLNSSSLALMLKLTASIVGVNGTFFVILIAQQTESASEMAQKFQRTQNETYRLIYNLCGQIVFYAILS